MNKTTRVVEAFPATNGEIHVRLDKQTASGQRNHRFSIAPTMDVDQVILVVNAHLVGTGFAEISQADIELIKDIAATVWTPAVIAAYIQTQAESAQ